MPVQLRAAGLEGPPVLRLSAVAELPEIASLPEEGEEEGLDALDEIWPEPTDGDPLPPGDAAEEPPAPSATDEMPEAVAPPPAD